MSESIVAEGSSPSNLEYHLDQIPCNETIGIAVFVDDVREVGGCNLSDFAREAYDFLYRPTFLSESELGLLIRVVHTICYQHRLQKRKTGEDVKEHPRATYRTILDLGVKDVNILAAALLHDAIEDCYPKITIWKILRWFGPRIAVMVYGMTRSKSWLVPHRWKVAVITLFEPYLPVIKLADCKHNLLTLWGGEVEWQIKWLKKLLGVTIEELNSASKILVSHYPEVMPDFIRLHDEVTAKASEELLRARAELAN